MATKKKKSEDQKIRSALRNAFPFPSRRDLQPLSHDDCLYMRSRLAMVAQEDLPSTLRQVLEDLLLSHQTGEEIEDADFVVRYLDVDKKGIDIQSIKEVFGTRSFDRTALDLQTLREGGRSSFASFNTTQAEAIWLWLKYVRPWPELRFYRTELDAAIEYWKDRAEVAKNEAAKVLAFQKTSKR